MSDYICQELVFEIFTRLPPKSLLRFRSLSKSWYSCISSPFFNRMHTFRSPQKLLIRHRKLAKKNHEFTLHSEDQLPLCATHGYFGITPVECSYGNDSWIIGSCNGILCLFNSEENRISLWNPSVRRKLDLPDCPKRHKFSRYAQGYGFDPITNDYKIVIVFYPPYGEIVESSYVYSMKTGAWCAIALPAPLDILKSFRACFVNGALHWLVSDDFNDVDGYYILTFDLSTHVFGKISLPKPSSECEIVTTIQGSLAVISTRDDNSWIWVRRDDSWSVAFTLKETILEVFMLTRNGDLISYIAPEGYQVYNPKTGAQSTLVKFNDDYCIFDIEKCVETLQLLDMGMPAS